MADRLKFSIQFNLNRAQFTHMQNVPNLPVPNLPMPNLPVPNLPVPNLPITT